MSEESERAELAVALSALSTGQLIEELNERGVPHDNCLEKGDLICLLMASLCEKRAAIHRGEAAESNHASEIDSELSFALELSEVTCRIPSIRHFFLSDAWRFATVSFIECFALRYDSSGGNHNPARVYLAFKRLIERLVREQLLPLDGAPDLSQLALFCELVGSSDVLDGWLDSEQDHEVVEAAKLMLLVQDESSFAELMREYAGVANAGDASTPRSRADEAGASISVFVADADDTFGFAALFSDDEFGSIRDAEAAAADEATTVADAMPETQGGDMQLMPSQGFATLVQHSDRDADEREVISTRTQREIVASQRHAPVVQVERVSDDPATGGALRQERIRARPQPAAHELVEALTLARSIVSRRKT